MSSLDSKQALSESGDGDWSDEKNEGNLPPPYQEASSSLASFRRPSIRTLRLQYDERKNPKLINVSETNSLGEGQQPLYWAKLHITKLNIGGSHMEFKAAPHDEEDGSAKFHKTGGPRIDLTFRDGKSTDMTGFSGTTYSLMNFSCPSIGAEGRRPQWKRRGQGLHLICVDPDGNDEKRQVASIQFGALGNPVGELAINDEDLSQNGHWVEEIMISGLAYIHLSKFMSNYAGGRSSIGVGV